jgi:AhpD family alkylhydroperoxidase
MSKNYIDITGDISAYSRELRKAAPEGMAAFYALAKAASAEGTMDKKSKELVALAIGVTQRCDGCIGFHVKTLKDLGTTRAEIVELLMMCVYMGGGPALMYAADALRAYDQFTEVA